MTLDQIAHTLKGKKYLSGWKAHCPAHDDRTPSLSLTEHNGTLLVKCHAGCAQADVIDALRGRGLWPEKRDSWESRIIATYHYTDATGKLLYQVVRLAPKDFRQRRPDGKGGWVWNLTGVPRVLYRVREVLEAPIVFLVEGERDVETLRSWGFVATTNAGGAKAPWLPQYTEALKGHEVIIVPDNDGPGWERALRIGRELIHHVARLRFFDLPTDCKDITEWFDRGHSEVELISTLEGVHAV